MVATITSWTDAARSAGPRRDAHPSAATAEVAARLHGPRRSTEIVHRSRHAVYVRDGDRCLAVLARDAVAVPCGLLTGWPDLAATRTVVLGEGVCVVDGRTLRVSRYVEARVAVRPALAADDLSDASLLVAVAAHLPTGTTAYDRLGDDDPRAVAGLLGRGPGLTPLGDDVLAGWLVTRYAAGLHAGQVVDRVLSDAPTRTTTVSATLLSHAARGEAVPELRALVDGLGAPGTDARLAALLEVGHTSGAGLALGVALAVRRRAAVAA
ncbi:DUF2877 domain-containing protein [Mumia sp. Pv 4-285]|uniref:DUF2877 domain-containing protein n=1 Tax=Mumia qirimensis TaxID=3234852 RepID=UPI00351D8BBB